MLDDLFYMPERRQSIGPELIRFFSEDDSVDWPQRLDRFLRMFAGTTFDVPGPEFLVNLRNDERIVRALRQDDSARRRLELMEEYGVEYTHIQRVWQAVAGKTLNPPMVAGGRYEMWAEAAVLIRRHHGIANDIMTMYAMDARDRMRTSEMVATMTRLRTYKPPEKPKRYRLTDKQKDILRALMGRKSTTLEHLEKSTRVAHIRKTINSLVNHGLVHEYKNGNIAITLDGREAIRDG